MNVRAQIVSAFLESHPAEAADALSEFPPTEAARVISEAPPARGAAVLGRLPPNRAADCAAAMSPEALAALLGHVPAHAAARLLRSVSAESRDLVFGKLPHHRRSRLELQLRFPSESVGALMDSEVTAYPHHWTLGRLRAAIDERPRAGLPYAYVIDDHALLVGVVSLRNLDFPDRTPLGTLMRSPVESVYAYAPINSVGDHPGWRQHDCLPVTSAGGLLVGTLRHRDLRRSGSPGSAGAADLGEVLMTISQLWWTGMWNAVDGLAGTDGGPEGERAGADR